MKVSCGQRPRPRTPLGFVTIYRTFQWATSKRPNPLRRLSPIPTLCPVCSYVLEHYEHLSTHVEVRDAHALLTMLKDMSFRTPLARPIHRNLSGLARLGCKGG